MAKNFWKFVGGFGALLILGAGIFYGVQYYQYRQSPQFQAQKQFEELERLYAEDTFGGSTPEETLQLFIEALKKGDIELASKYFVIDEQERWKKFLSEIATSENYGEWLLNFSNAKKINADENRAIFEYETKATKEISVEGTNIKILPGIYKNSISLLKIQNERWKLQEI